MYNTEFFGQLTESPVATMRPELPPWMKNTKDGCHYNDEIFIGLKPSALALSTSLYLQSLPERPVSHRCYQMTTCLTGLECGSALMCLGVGSF